MKTGYLYNAQVYLGKEGRLPETGQGQRMVLDLAVPLFRSGRNITEHNIMRVKVLSTLLTNVFTLTHHLVKPEGGQRNFFSTLSIVQPSTAL